VTVLAVQLEVGIRVGNETVSLSGMAVLTVVSIATIGRHRLREMPTLQGS
jgi:hypothetical protein